MKVLSLFDGISCGMVALERARITVERYDAFEIDKYAIRISQKNYPDIVHHGDVFDGDFTQFKGYDLLFGGSPCTYWSIAKSKRETTPDGMGGQLFMQYVRALNEAKPKYFLYENNYSIHKNIKEYISEKLGVEPIMINSALVSGQQRKRCYWTNIPNVAQPEDKGILLKDILESGISWQDKSYCMTATYNGACISHTLKRHARTMVAEPVNNSISLSPYKMKKFDEYAKKHDGQIPIMFNAYNCAEITDKSPTITASCGISNTSGEVILFDKPQRIGQYGKGAQGQRIYSVYGKSVTLSANGGGQGAKTGLYKIDLPDGNYIIRKLTPLEAERLQTLPDNYTAGISNTQRYKCIGNGWTVDVIAHILKGVKENIMLYKGE